MLTSRYVLAIDQGTSATKAVLVAADGSVAALGTAPVAQAFPAPGWVEQDPADIWASVQSAVAACLESAPAGAAAQVVAVGLSTQRESAVLWERATGKPLAPLVSWQDRRTADRARALLEAGHGDAVLALTGLPIDPMFSALKFGWLLDGLDPDRVRSRAGELCLGTVDAWLLAQFAEPGTEPVVEIGNASRTQLLDLRTGQWDARLLDLFGVPAAALPTVIGSAGPFPATRGLAPLPDGTPVLAVLGDSHAALFAHAGWRPGVVKATYGTGSSVMALGTPRGEAVGGVPAGGVCATIAWQVDDPAPALEANIRSTGRTLTWLADLFDTDVATLLAEAATTFADGVTLVPAFGGLGAPWWDAEAAPVLSGFSLGTTRANVARAALESIAFQVADVLAATAEVGVPLTALVVDGGPSRNDVLMQLQADVSGVPVHRPAAAELSALGAASLAGLTAGLWTWTELEERGSAASQVFHPQWPADVRAARVAEWRRGVDRTRVSTAPTAPTAAPSPPSPPTCRPQGAPDERRSTSSAAATRPAPGLVAPPVEGVLIAVAAVAVLLVAMGLSTTFVDAAAPVAGARQAFDPAAYGKDTYGPKVVPAIEKAAVPLTELAPALQADKDAAGEKFGTKPAPSSPYSYAVTFTGTAGKAVSGLMQVTVPGVAARVSVQVGPAVNGTALRDAVGFITFGQFLNQVEYADAGTALNTEMKAQLLSTLDPASLEGQQVTVTGATTPLTPDVITVTPIALAAGA